MHSLTTNAGQAGFERSIIQAQYKYRVLHTTHCRLHMVIHWCPCTYCNLSALADLLRTASSNSPGRLVAPMTMTLLFKLVSMPSHRDMNSFFMLMDTSCSCSLRLPSKASTSSAYQQNAYSSQMDNIHTQQ